MIEQEDFDDVDLAPFAFADPFTAISVDMWVNYRKLGSMKANDGAAMMVRPRLTLHDLQNMVELPEGIQSFQYGEKEFCATAERRRRVAMALSSGRRRAIWRRMGARQMPGARLR